MGLIGGKRCYDSNDSEYVGGGTSWWTKCPSDPRFDMSGTSAGIWSAMDDVDRAILARAKSLRIQVSKIPEDIEYGGCK